MRYIRYKKKRQKKERKNDFVIDGTTGKRIKEDKRNETIVEKNLREYLELQEKVKKHNPIPIRGDSLPRARVSEDLNSSFVNVREGYFNKGSKRGCDVASAKLDYLIWITNNIELNNSELAYIKKVIKYKENKN